MVATQAGRTVVAVMQPYFAPYAGYYRLMAAADVFVLFDCVQFPRRGWVHRNRLPDAQGQAQWLTLPLSPAPFEAVIADLAFAPEAGPRMAERLRAFPSLASPRSEALALLHAGPFRGGFVDYAEAQLQVAGALLKLRPRLLRSSRLGLPAGLRGADRVLEIVRRLGATDYVNAPGGVALYDPASFAAAGTRLHVLPPYEGASWSLLHRLAIEPPETIAAEIHAQLPPALTRRCSPTPAA